MTDRLQKASVRITADPIVWRQCIHCGLAKPLYLVNEEEAYMVDWIARYEASHVCEPPEGHTT